MSTERRKRRKWKAVLTNKEDVIVVRLALLLREAGEWYKQRDVASKAFAFNGQKRPTGWES